MTISSTVLNRAEKEPIIEDTSHKRTCMELRILQAAKQALTADPFSALHARCDALIRRMEDLDRRIDAALEKLDGKVISDPATDSSTPSTATTAPLVPFSLTLSPTKTSTGSTATLLQFDGLTLEQRKELIQFLRAKGALILE